MTEEVTGPMRRPAAADRAPEAVTEAAPDTAPEPAPVLAEVWRGGMLECVHRGAAVICTPDGEVVAAWGDPGRVILPRSSCKMV
jgi:hypothetical protein